MSNGARPRGREPAAVYRRRRIVVLAVVVALVALLWWWLGGDNESAPSTRPAAAVDRPEPSEAATAAEKRHVDKKKPRRPKQRISTELAAPRGSCDVADVVAVPDVADAETRGPVPLRLGLSTTAGKACTLHLTADMLALDITSGDELIWRSSYCPDVLDPQSLTLRPGWLSYVEATWSGRRGSADCLAANEFAEPGYYWAEAAVIGGEPARGQFELEAPPPPPSKAPRGESEDQT
ncbi:MAG TPA: hypothetical protein VFJ14_13580 [Nocardioidaceae bacterium]|nr:hypothetical protein [Nocardioidaceae bacterium]